MWYPSTLLAEGRMEKRVFALADCEPDVVSMLPQIRLDLPHAYSKGLAYAST